jgi:hypothetical protein
MYVPLVLRRRVRQHGTGLLCFRRRRARTSWPGHYILGLGLVLRLGPDRYSRHGIRVARITAVASASGYKWTRMSMSVKMDKRSRGWAAYFTWTHGQRSWSLLILSLL